MQRISSFRKLWSSKLWGSHNHEAICNIEAKKYAAEPHNADIIYTYR